MDVVHDSLRISVTCDGYTGFIDLWSSVYLYALYVRGHVGRRMNDQGSFY